MQYLTVQEYADIAGVSRQAIEDRIARKTLGVVLRPAKHLVRMIPVDDTSDIGVKAITLLRSKGEE